MIDDGVARVAAPQIAPSPAPAKDLRYDGKSDGIDPCRSQPSPLTMRVQALVDDGVGVKSGPSGTIASYRKTDVMC